MCSEASKIASGERNTLNIGYLRSFSGVGFQNALEKFKEKYPDADIFVKHGCHEELKNLPCILVAPPSQHDTEQEYYRSVTGIEGEFIFAENPDEARLMLIGRKGFLPTDGKVPPCASPIARVPLMRGDDPIMRHYCAFWKKDSSGYYAEGFADMRIF